MSRPIKFRAWDKEEKEYYYNAEYTYDFYCSGRGCYAESFGEVLNQPDRFIVEQYIGITDKNGKEIYEGDIVKTNSPDRANFNAGAIVMQQQMYLIINTPTYGDARLSHSEPLGYYFDMECEVIGNVHEDGELLND